jgi:hypothetical protein
MLPLVWWTNAFLGQQVLGNTTTCRKGIMDIKGEHRIGRPDALPLAFLVGILIAHTLRGFATIALARVALVLDVI